LSNLYLVRHGQAGTRENYDSLSELGRRQSRLLGEYFLAQGIMFDAAYTGAMSRQQQTAIEIKEAYSQAALPFPDIIVDDQWNEFDLAHIYSEIGPLLREIDPEFQREYDEMRQEIRHSAGAHAAEVHRRWRPCDTKIVNAWITERVPYSGESWRQFCERVASSCLKLSAQPQSNILVSTSATPTGVLTGLALDIIDGRVRQLAGVLFNSSYSLFRLRGGHLQLFQFNTVPHLTPELRTHR
jgi:broad specificity phosphatase PhoE